MLWLLLFFCFSICSFGSLLTVFAPLCSCSHACALLCFCSSDPRPLILLRCDSSVPSLLLLPLCFCLLPLLFYFWSFALALLLLFFLSGSFVSPLLCLCFAAPAIPALLFSWSGFFDLSFAFHFLRLELELELGQIWFLFPRGGFMVFCQHVMQSKNPQCEICVEERHFGHKKREVPTSSF